MTTEAAAKKKENAWWVYMIETHQHTLYTGIATDIERRFSEHLACYEKTPLSKAKKGAKYFRRYKPVDIVYRESFDSRSEASQREYAIKQLSSAEKRKLLDV